jgi:hypothetical protein
MKLEELASGSVGAKKQSKLKAYSDRVCLLK